MEITQEVLIYKPKTSRLMIKHIAALLVSVFVQLGASLLYRQEVTGGQTWTSHNCYKCPIKIFNLDETCKQWSDLLLSFVSPSSSSSVSTFPVWILCDLCFILVCSYIFLSWRVSLVVFIIGSRQIRPWTVGPRGLTVRGPTAHFFGGGQLWTVLFLDIQHCSPGSPGAKSDTKIDPLVGKHCSAKPPG